MFEQLRHLLLIVEHGSFTAAARHAHLSQPALTASIQRLEERIGAQLLERRPRGAVPTAAGLALVPHARAALAAVRTGQTAVAEVQGLARGEVRIGGGGTACSYLLPQALAGFHRLHPGLKLRVREVFTPQVPAAVAAGELDLGVGVSGAPGLHSDVWRTDPVALVAHASLTVARDGDRVAPGFPALSLLPGASLRAQLATRMSDLDVVMELGSIESVKGHVAQGLGVALLPLVAVAQELERGELVRIADVRTPEPRTLLLLHPGVDRLAPGSRALRRYLLGLP
jgi:DNA-binding transcriptional LysR family regulator